VDFPSASLGTEVDAHPAGQPRQSRSTRELPRSRSAEQSDIEADAAAIVAAVEVGGTLTEHQRSILDFERRWWSQPGAKEQAIRDNFEMSPTRYYQALNTLLDLPQALSYDPTLVNRLQRLRSSAMRGRRLR
jgi:hypothetical protein